MDWTERPYNESIIASAYAYVQLGRDVRMAGRALSSCRRRELSSSGGRGAAFTFTLSRNSHSSSPSGLQRVQSYSEWINFLHNHRAKSYDISNNINTFMRSTALHISISDSFDLLSTLSNSNKREIIMSGIFIFINLIRFLFCISSSSSSISYIQFQPFNVVGVGTNVNRGRNECLQWNISAAGTVAASMWTPLSRVTPLTGSSSIRKGEQKEGEWKRGSHYWWQNGALAWGSLERTHSGQLWLWG